MMHRTVWSIFLLASAIGHGDCAAVEADSGEITLPSLPELHAVHRKADGRVTIIRYEGQQIASVHATDFDARLVVIAYGADRFSVATVAGIDRRIGGAVTQTVLVKPPYEDEVIRRSMEPRPTKYKYWTVYAEDIYYAKQGAEFGYTMDCATAIGRFVEFAVAVAECYDLSNRDAFLRTLDSVAEYIEALDRPRGPVRQ